MAPRLLRPLPRRWSAVKNESRWELPEPEATLDPYNNPLVTPLKVRPAAAAVLLAPLLHAAAAALPGMHCQGHS